MLRFITYILCALLSFNLSAYIISVHIITLVSGQELILMYDAYEGFSEEANNINAMLVLSCIKKIALKEPNEVFEFSYEDPGVYELGEDLPQLLAQHTALVERIEADQFALFIKPIPGIPKFNCFGLAKPQSRSSMDTGLTTFLAGSMSKIIALVESSEWPKNLVMRSNDPRRDYFMPLTADPTWLHKYGAFHSVKKLILPAEAFVIKRASWQLESNLPEYAHQYLNMLIENIKHIERHEVENLANYFSIKLEKEFSPDLLCENIRESSSKNENLLGYVHEFLGNRKHIIDIYQDAPILDVLISMSQKEGPQRFITVLGAHTAKKLREELISMNLIESDTAFDGDEAIKGFFSMP